MVEELIFVLELVVLLLLLSQRTGMKMTRIVAWDPEPSYINGSKSVTSNQDTTHKFIL